MFRIASTPGHRAFRERPVFFFCASPAREISSAPGTSSSRCGAKSKAKSFHGREKTGSRTRAGLRWSRGERPPDSASASGGLEGTERSRRSLPAAFSPLWARVLVCKAPGRNPKPATSSPSLFDGSFSSSPGASPLTRVRLRRPGFLRGTVESCSFIGRADRGRLVAQPRANPRPSAAAKSSSPPAVRRRNSGAPTASATVAFIPVLASMPTSRARTAVAAGVPPPTSSLIE